MNTLLQTRSDAIAALSASIQDLGVKYRQVLADSNQIARALGTRSSMMPLAMGDHDFTSAVIQAVNAALVNHYGDPNNPALMVIGPLGQISNTELLTVQAANDHAQMAEVLP